MGLETLAYLEELEGYAAGRDGREPQKKQGQLARFDSNVP